MATTRIFVRGLPPSLTEGEFKAHFAQRYVVTDTKLLAHRRFGYVGFRTPQDAIAAVKYYNKSFVRMSRIGVELVDDTRPRVQSSHPTSLSLVSNFEDNAIESTLKRKQETSRQDLHSRKAPRLDADKLVDNDKSSDNVQLLGREIIGAEAKDLSIIDGEAINGSPAPERYSNEEQLSAPPSATLDEAEDQPPVSNQDWIRSRTSRLLGLVEDDEDGDHGNRGGEQEQESRTKKGANSGDGATINSAKAGAVVAPSQEPTPPPEVDNGSAGPEDEPPSRTDEAGPNVEDIRQSRRLFLRNLPYSTHEEDLAELFKSYDSVEEVHLSSDARSGEGKGFAFVQFSNSDDAVKAYRDLDKTVFQGRLLHVLPGTSKRETRLDEDAISKLPLKKQKQIQRKAEASSSTFNWNSMYMNTDAVVSSISLRLGIPKSVIIDATSSNAAVKQAQAETHVIQETKGYFEANGIDLNSFRKRERGDTAILAKNFSFGTTSEDLRGLFEQHGDVTRVLMPPSGTIAIVDFKQADHARSAFRTLAYRKFKDSVLFLEKAPKDLFRVPTADQQSTESPPEPVAEPIDHDKDGSMNTSTLFVRNLNFVTSNERFLETFRPLDGLISARVKTKPDPKRAGQTLSMGFGFLEFRTTAQAKAALKAMDGYTLDNHKLLIRASHKGHDAAEERRLTDQDSKNKSKKSKIIIKNLAFEVSKKDIRELFQSYGQLRAVRLPKKFDNSRKGYAFAEFTTPREAESAIAALRDTHLLGRKLVLEYASGEADDPEREIEKMQQKVGRQSNSLALQKLQASSERRKFMVGEEEVEI